MHTQNIGCFCQRIISLPKVNNELLIFGGMLISNRRGAVVCYSTVQRARTQESVCTCTLLTQIVHLHTPSEIQVELCYYEHDM